MFNHLLLSTSVLHVEFFVDGGVDAFFRVSPITVIKFQHKFFDRVVQCLLARSSAIILGRSSIKRSVRMRRRTLSGGVSIFFAALGLGIFTFNLLQVKAPTGTEAQARSAFESHSELRRVVLLAARSPGLFRPLVLLASAPFPAHYFPFLPFFPCLRCGLLHLNRFAGGRYVAPRVR